MSYSAGFTVFSLAFQFAQTPIAVFLLSEHFLGLAPFVFLSTFCIFYCFADGFRRLLSITFPSGALILGAAHVVMDQAVNTSPMSFHFRIRFLAIPKSRKRPRKTNFT